MQLGRLSGLVALNLKGLSNLQDPPQSVVNDTGSCMRYLKSKLKSARPFYELKLMLLGDAHCGKTTLLTQLVGRNCQNNETTCNVSRWEYRVGLGTKFCFTVWDMGSQEGYYASYQCFLTECSMYLLLFNLTDGEEGVRKLEPWLSSLSFRAPWSCVLIVGTHVDRIPIGERASKANEVLLKANMLAAKFSHRLKIKQTLAVGLNMGVDVLRDTIYHSAEGYKQKNGVLVMGQLVPLSYHKLNSHILGILLKEVRTGSCDTIMYREEFKALIHRLNLSDLQGEDELRAVTSFLTNVGTLQHFDHHNHNLHQLYFLDPQWLWRKVAMMVNVRGVVPYVRDSIMAIRDIPLLLNDEKFPWQHIEQFLTLLDCFDVALVLDNNRIFVPFTLPEVPPPEACEVTEVGGEPLYTRYVHFTTTLSHPGFWNRLMSQAMYFIPQVWFALSASAAAAAATSASEGAPVGTRWEEPAVLFVPCEGRFCTEQRLSIAEPSAAKLLYWSTGLFYRDRDVMFKVELEAVKQCVSIATSPSPLGMKMAGQLLDLVVSLMNDWYTEMLQDKECFNQAVLCRECVRLKNTEPYRFDVQKCLTLAATQSKNTIDCCYHPDGVTKNHSVPLTDIIPDLLFEDVVTEFHLNYAELNFSDNHLLGTGGFSSVYHGTYRGESVAVKKYVCGDRAFSELRKEVMMLQRFHHPCVVRLVGVCIHPSVLLVLEEAPLGSLENVLSKEGGQVHRVVIHRIAAQVAAALKCLHDNSIIFRDLKAANVLLWSLDPGHVCHCKLTDFGLATHLAPIGARGIFGTKGFTAPEVLYVGSRREYSVYNHKADIFSFGILLYQMISCKHPFIDMQPVMINSAIESGERPKLHDVPQSECAYFYLTRLMQCCWHGNPRRRPTTSEIIDKVCLSSMQSVMAVQPVQSKLSLRHACVVLITGAGVPSTSAELWVSCDGIGGTEISIYATNTMIKSSRLTIKDSQAQCICQCGDHVWVASGAGLEYGMIDIFNVASRELVHSIRMKDHSISCMAFSNSTVYCGTVEGFCLAFRSDIGQVKSRTEPSCCKYICGDAVDGVLAARDCLWLSHTHQISLHSLSTLAVEGAFGRSSNQRQFVGQLKMSADGATIWSFQLGGSYVSAWSSTQKCHIFDIDVRTHMRGICQCQERDMIITAMAPARDTVWVGLATGHILVFRVELLMWFHPYTDYVRFLVCMPSDVHYATKKTVVVSGAKEFRSPFIPNLPDYETVGGNVIAVDKAGVLVMWEAFPSRMCQQISLLQSHSSTFLDSHDSVKEVIKKGSFNDGALGNDMFSTREVNGACSSLKAGTEVLSPFAVLEHAVSEESKREQDLVKAEVKKGVLAEVKTEVMAEVKKGVLAEVKTEVMAEVKKGVLAEVKTEVMAEVKKGVLAEVKTEVMAEVKKGVLAEVKTEVMAEVKKGVLAEVKKGVLAEVKTEVMAELGVKTELEVKAGQDQPIS